MAPMGFYCRGKPRHADRLLLSPRGTPFRLRDNGKRLRLEAHASRSSNGHPPVDGRPAQMRVSRRLTMMAGATSFASIGGPALHARDSPCGRGSQVEWTGTADGWSDRGAYSVSDRCTVVTGGGRGPLVCERSSGPSSRTVRPSTARNVWRHDPSSGCSLSRSFP